MARITNKDMDSIANVLTVNARICGIVDEDETVYVHRGNTSQGYATRVSIIRRDPWNERHPHWLPRFSYKDTARTQYKAIEAAADALRVASSVIEGLRGNAADAERDS